MDIVEYYEHVWPQLKEERGLPKDAEPTRDDLKEWADFNRDKILWEIENDADLR